MCLIKYPFKIIYFNYIEKVVTVHLIKAPEGVEIYFNSFVTSVLDRGERSTLRPLYPQGNIPWYSYGSLYGTRDELHVLEKRTL
jgi:hypothetical protein